MQSTNDIFTAEAIDTAYSCLCKQRRHFPPNADIWDLRFHWQTMRPVLLEQLRTGSYTLSPQQYISKAKGSSIHLWSPVDALALKDAS